MIRFANGKISHWWHWQQISLKTKHAGLILPHDPAAFRKKTQLDEVKMSLGGWKKACIVTPKKRVPWQIAIILTKNTVRKCSLVLEGPVKLLLGPHAVTVVGFNLRGEQIALVSGNPMQREDRPDIPIV